MELEEFDLKTHPNKKENKFYTILFDIFKKSKNLLLYYHLIFHLGIS